MTLTAAAEFNLFDCAAYAVLSGVAGTNTITATGPATYTLAATRPPVWFIPAGTNTGATTINITASGGSALGAKNIFCNGTALIGGELRSGVPVGIVYDGTQFNILGYVSNPTLMTEQAASGTSVTFSSIPAWAKRITIQFVGVSTDGTSKPLIQLGDSGGAETTGYVSASAATNGAGGGGAGTSTAGFVIQSEAAANTIYGTMTLTLEDASENNWVGTHTMGFGNVAFAVIGGGSKNLSAALDRIVITTVNGTDAYDAGFFNILYE